jgi:hypothetical protein
MQFYEFIHEWWKRREKIYHCNTCYVTWIIQEIPKDHFKKVTRNKELTCASCGLTTMNNPTE